MFDPADPFTHQVLAIIGAAMGSTYMAYRAEMKLKAKKKAALIRAEDRKRARAKHAETPLLTFDSTPKPDH